LTASFLCNISAKYYANLTLMLACNKGQYADSISAVIYSSSNGVTLQHCWKMLNHPNDNAGTQTIYLTRMQRSFAEL